MIKKIKNYVPYTDQEKCDKKNILKFMDQFDNCYVRDNTFGHLTASTWVINEDETKILLLHHNDFNGYIYPGGHADGDTNLFNVAMKELNEETNLNNVIACDEIFSLDCGPIMNHVKRGKNISAHIHYNISYLVIVPNAEMNKIKVLETENSDVKWFDLDEVEISSLVPFFRPIFVDARNKIRDRRS